MLYAYMTGDQDSNDLNFYSYTYIYIYKRVYIIIYIVYEVKNILPSEGCQFSNNYKNYK